MSRTLLAPALLIATLAGCGITEEAAWGDRIARDGSVARVFDADPAECDRAIRRATGIDFESESIDLEIQDGNLEQAGVKLIPVRDAEGRPVSEWTVEGDRWPFPLIATRLSGKGADGRVVRARLELADGGKRTIAEVRIGPEEDPAYAREILDRTEGWIGRLRAGGPASKAESPAR